MDNVVAFLDEEGPSMVAQGSPPRTGQDGTILDTVAHYFALVADRLALDPGIRVRLSHPRRSLIVGVPLRRDTGEIEMYTG